MQLMSHTTEKKTKSVGGVFREKTIIYSSLCFSLFLFRRYKKNLKNKVLIFYWS